MCGIAGILSPQSRELTDSLTRMVTSLRHRGPDGSGIRVFDACALGHTRLSIVDLAGGQQPMEDVSGNMCVTFNGEIYGYQEIKRGLKNYPFRSDSDTEVILALYQEHGERMITMLPGMFAFALWDERRNRLFCARDRFGEKPFFYATGRRGDFVFASEIKALLASGLIDPEISRKSLAHYLGRGYVHPAATIYSNVHVLPPGHTLSYEGGSLRVCRYWSAPTSTDQMDLSDAVVEFRRLFEQAVNRQLVADVPVGAFLSGGLDSSSVVAAACGGHPGIRTLSFGFGERDDELPFAAEVARKFGTDHIEMKPESADLACLLHEMQQVYDEPFADSSNIPTYLLCREARNHLKVVLTGDGGDELLGGYAWYHPLFWFDRARGNSALPYATARALLAIFDRHRIRRLAGVRERSRGIVLGRRYRSACEAHAAENLFFTADQIGAMGLPTNGLAPANINSSSDNDSLDDVMRMDVSDYMPGDILVKIDRASMAHGLELRAPFLDVDFAEFCLSLPAKLKFDGRRDKIILREAYSSQWPPSIRARSKRGFGAPVRSWLADPSMRDLQLRHVLQPSASIRDLLRLRAGNETIQNPSGYQAWILLVLGMWLETHGSLGRGEKPDIDSTEAVTPTANGQASSEHLSTP
jgi:asparagine synthase (glutamine-hydrolysing)